MNRYIAIGLILGFLSYVRIFSDNKEMNFFSKILFSVIVGLAVAISVFFVSRIGFKLNF